MYKDITEIPISMWPEFIRQSSKILQTWAREHGWADYIYAPYQPLVMTDITAKSLQLNGTERFSPKEEAGGSSPPRDIT